MIHPWLSVLVKGSAVFVLAVYVVINLYYLIVHVVSLVELRRGLRERKNNPGYERVENPFLPGIAIIIPAFNEAETIVSNIRSALDQTYPEKTVIVVNDGSTDGTLQSVSAAFELEEIDDSPPWDLNCKPVRGIYRSKTVSNLLVIDKKNGGKSDALNAGIWLTDQELFCTVDADSLIDREGLWQTVVPFLTDPQRTIASGGSVRVANACQFEGSQVRDVSVSRNPLVGFQEIEYLRAFYSGRLGLSHLDLLLVISGTFGLFRTDMVREVGGYSHETVTEDLELVVRLHRHIRELDEPYDVTFVPEPVVWTQVPDNIADLSRQRRRWYRGLLETASMHKGIVGRPEYGVIGSIALPLYVLSEGIGPIVETFGYIIVPLAFLAGLVDVSFFFTFLILIIGIGLFLSLFSLVSEVWGYRRYTKPSQIALLTVYAIFENVGYRQWKAYTALRGLLEYLRNRSSWGQISRNPFQKKDSD